MLMPTPNGSFHRARKMAAPSALPANVLIVDDLEEVRWALSNVVRTAGFAPVVAASGKEALARLVKTTPDLVLLDVGLPDMDGFEVLARIRAHDKSIPVIMVTGNARTADAVHAMRDGAFDYLAKPFLNQDIMLTVHRALEERLLKDPPADVRSDSRAAEKLLDSMGGSTAMRRIQTEVERVAATRLSVLILGESGTGKELVARAIHASSPRAGMPFVALDCGSIPSTLIERELFGHEKGSFTGAHQAVAGAFELAAGGTLFLDEIGNLPLATQSTLLRAIEEQCIRRIGATREQRIDFRLIAATNVNLHNPAHRQTFRDDLYYRLAEFPIHLPPLRDRSDDVIFLAQRFLAQANAELGREVAGFSKPAQQALLRHSWPGNARELRNCVRRAALLCSDPAGIISPDLFDGLALVDTPPDIGVGASEAGCCPLGQGPTMCALRETLLRNDDDAAPLKDMMARVTNQAECLVVSQALMRAGGNKALAGRRLGIDYKTMHKKLNLHKISSSQFIKEH